jgi:trk system potassium uptake protein TrkH
MNYTMIFSTLGKVLKIAGVLFLLPILVSVCYSEWNIALILLATAIITFVIGFIVTSLLKPKNQIIFSKEGFIIVAFSWIIISIVTAIPFVISREIPSFVDALFESVSGYTTTGASILLDPSKLSYGLIFLRSFTNFIGGMGILVFVIAIMPKNTDRNIHILRAEMPGPVVDKILPKSKDTAKILYLIYVGMTALLVILLKFGGMSLFESVLHAFSTAGTGGFGIKADSISSYNNYVQWVIAIFMILYGVNFNIYFLILVGKFTTAIKSKELLTYGLILISAILLIGLNVYPIYQNLNDTLRHTVFQVSSITTTTGFSTTNFDVWSPFAKGILLVLMLIGACAGSTSGGFKIYRVSILVKKISYSLKKLIHPNRVEVITFDGKQLDDETVNGVTSYFAIYAILTIIFFLLISIDGLSLETNLSAVIACINNIGPGFSSVASNYTCYSAFSKIVLSIAMLFGRLEIYPILLAFSPLTWAKK